MEHEETLKASAVIGKLTDTIQDLIDNLLSDSVVTACVVVGSILFAINNLLRMVELTVRSMTDFVTNRWFQIDIDGTRNMLASASLRKEGVEGVFALSDRIVLLHGTIGVDTVLEAVKLPAVVTSLDTSLAQVDGDTFC
jgi:hypothetical protein